MLDNILLYFILIVQLGITAYLIYIFIYIKKKLKEKPKEEQPSVSVNTQEVPITKDVYRDKDGLLDYRVYNRPVKQDKNQKDGGT